MNSWCNEWKGSFVVIIEKLIYCSYRQTQGRGMSSQLVRPNMTLRTMQLNAWVADMNIEILFLPLILKCLKVTPLIT